MLGTPFSQLLHQHRSLPEGRDPISGASAVGAGLCGCAGVMGKSFSLSLKPPRSGISGISICASLGIGLARKQKAGVESGEEDSNLVSQLNSRDGGKWERGILGSSGKAQHGSIGLSEEP